GPRPDRPRRRPRALVGLAHCRLSIVDCRLSPGKGDCPPKFKGKFKGTVPFSGRQWAIELPPGRPAGRELAVGNAEQGRWLGGLRPGCHARSAYKGPFC